MSTTTTAPAAFTATSNDEHVVDAIAALLGTTASWSGADMLDAIAALVSETRPHPGDAGDYRQEFATAMGRRVPAAFDCARGQDKSVLPAPLPELVPGEDGAAVPCQHALTADEVRAAQERHDQHVGASWRRPVPAVGDQCGQMLTAQRPTTEYRHLTAWDGRGGAFVSGSDFGDSDADSTVTWLDGHAWAVPDLEWSGIY